MWAIKSKGKDVFFAEQQYGPPGALTVCSREGRPPVYSPKKLDNREEAEAIAKKLVGIEEFPGKAWEWEVVEI